MSDFATRRAQALHACEKVINGIEDGTITVSSALLLCMKIARLVNDNEGQEWLSYEHGGYPITEDGHVTQRGWEIGVKYGRSYLDNKDKNRYIFTDLAAELEETITSGRKAINNFTTQGFSVAGEFTALAVERMTQSVAVSTSNLMNHTKKSEKRLSLLKSQYYNYVLKWQIDLQFGNTAKRIFEEYQEEVDQRFTELPYTALQKLNAIEDMMEDGNPERYSQILNSCRRLWVETAKQLFDEVLPEYKEKTFKTKSGKYIDISGDHVNNKLSAIIETLQAKASNNTLVGSEITYLIDWIEQINDMQSSGVHSEITREQAKQCIIHTYIALGDILRLKGSMAQP